MRKVYVVSFAIITTIIPLYLLYYEYKSYTRYLNNQKLITYKIK